MKLALPYTAHLEMPLRWQDEQSGQLTQAVMAYLDSQIEKKRLSDEQFEYVRAWCQYYIEAPCWETAADPDSLTELGQRRQEIGEVKTAFELNEWIHRCLDLGIDPL